MNILRVDELSAEPLDLWRHSLVYEYTDPPVLGCHKTNRETKHVLIKKSIALHKFYFHYKTLYTHNWPIISNIDV